MPNYTWTDALSSTTFVIEVKRLFVTRFCLLYPGSDNAHAALFTLLNEKMKESI